MGFNSYVEISEEGTQVGTSWGVYSGLYRCFFYFNSESMVPAHEDKFLTEIGRTSTQNRSVKRHRQMGIKAEGGLDLVVYPESGGDKGGLGLLLKHCFGDVTSGTYSGEGTFLHSFIPHDDWMANLSTGTGLAAGTGRVFGLSYNIGREDDPGTLRNYPFLGNRIRSLTFSCTAGEEMMVSVDSVARVAKTNGTAILSASYPTMAPFLWKDATFQVGVAEDGSGGTERDNVEKFELTIDNNVKEVFTYGTNVLGRVVANGQRSVTGSYSCSYESWVRTEYEKWLSGTASSINVAFVNAPYRLEFRLPKIQYTGNAPNISTMEETVIDMPFQARLHTTFDVKIFLVNRDRQCGFVND